MTAPESTSIPYGYCHCGCGQKTRISPVSNNRNGYVKGEPQPYTLGHSGPPRLNREGPNPSGLCMCGCGEKTSLAPWSNKERGMEIGKPLRYISGHRSRLQGDWKNKGPHHKEEDRGYETPCWIWLHAIGTVGYGQLRENGKVVYAHRYYYEMEHGPIPKGNVLHHKCGVKSCCRPSHVESLTRREHFIQHFTFRP